MGKLYVRAAHCADLAALVEISAELNALHFAERPDQFQAVERSAIERWLLDLLKNPTAHVWVAERDGAVLGAAVATHQEAPPSPFLVPGRVWWYVDQVGVLAPYRRQGVCRALMQHAIAEACERGVTQIHLNSWAFNRTAHAAFARLGFRPRVIRFELSTDAAEPEP